MQDISVQNQPALVPTDLLNRSADRLQNRMRAAEAADPAKRDTELKKASQEFESIFIAYLLKVMRDTIEESGLTEGGFGKGIYTELFDQEMSRGIAQHGALGISDLIYKTLSQAPGSGGVGKSEAPHSQIPSTDVPVQKSAVEEIDPGIPDFKLPVQAPLSSGYGVRRDPFSHRLGLHKGIDLAAPAGTEVRAAKGGEVIFAGYEHGYGNSVVLQHPEGFQTRYAHLGAAGVKVGDVVVDEQVLGIVGNTGHSTGAHLHFEVIRRGEQIDPVEAMAE
ncbi:MAG TPA: M23 family metallopeptidase [Acidobacteriota bacterium]|nr:M23 family metallopeptidase [Acidobacteriota bacterium]